MKKINSISKASITGFFITAITFVILPLLIIPAEHRSEYFWLKILWAEVLAVLAWGYLGGGIQAILYSSIRINKSAAVIPALGITVAFYILVSLIFLIYGSFAFDNSFVNRYQLALQVFITFLFLITNIGLYTVAVIASKDSKTISPEIITPDRLSVMIQSEENRISMIPDITKEMKLFLQALKSLREKILYSLPSIQIIEDDHQYLNFVEQVNTFLSSVKKCSDGLSIKENGLKEKAEYLLRQTELIAANFKNR